MYVRDFHNSTPAAEAAILRFCCPFFVNILFINKRNVEKTSVLHDLEDVKAQIIRLGHVP